MLYAVGVKKEYIEYISSNIHRDMQTKIIKVNVYNSKTGKSKVIEIDKLIDMISEGIEIFGLYLDKNGELHTQYNLQGIERKNTVINKKCICVGVDKNTMNVLLVDSNGKVITETLPYILTSSMYLNILNMKTLKNPHLRFKSIYDILNMIYNIENYIVGYENINIGNINNNLIKTNAKLRICGNDNVILDSKRRYIIVGNKNEAIEILPITTKIHSDFINSSFGLEPREIFIHSKIKEIEKEAFAFQRKLQKVKMTGVRKIADRAFSFCSNLTEIDLGEELRFIGLGVFNNTPSLKRIRIPKSIETIYIDKLCNVNEEKIIEIHISQKDKINHTRDSNIQIQYYGQEG